MSYEWKHCPTCGNYGRTNKHHIYPQCHFNGKGYTINICENCHQFGIEKIMPPREICLTKKEYREIWKHFIEIQSLIYKINPDRVLKETFG